MLFLYLGSNNMTTLSTLNVPNVIPITSKLTVSITYVIVIQNITDPKLIILCRASIYPCISIKIVSDHTAPITKYGAEIINY